MAAKLIVEFVGLMALVPGDNCGHRGGTGCTVDVAVMNGEYGHATHTDVGRHEARLVVDLDALCTNRIDPHEDLCGDLESTTPDDYFASDYKRKAVWYLGRSEMSIMNAGAAGVILWDEETGTDKQPGTRLSRGAESTWKDLGWLGSVYRASEKKIFVNPLYLQQPKDTKTPWPVDALLRLTSGILAVGRPEHGRLRDGTWDFADNQAGLDSSHTRALSSLFTLEARAPSTGAVEIELKGFPGNGARDARIYLASRSDVAVTIASLPAHYSRLTSRPRPGGCDCETERAREAGKGEEEGIADGGAADAHVHGDHDPDSIDHFVAYYNLLMPGAARLRVPWRSGRPIPPIPPPQREGLRPQGLSPATLLALSSQDCPPALARRAKEPE